MIEFVKKHSTILKTYDWWQLNGKICSICLHDVMQNHPHHIICTNIPLLLVCGDTFHAYCLMDWIQTKGNIECPVCHVTGHN